MKLRSENEPLERKVKLRSEKTPQIHQVVDEEEKEQKTMDVTMADIEKQLFNPRKRKQREKERLQKLEKRFNAKTYKPNINMVIVGHVDAGKSTLMGHLLTLLGRVSKQELHRHKKEAQKSSGAKVTEFMR